MQTSSGLVGALNMPRRWARGMYDWTIRWAETPQSLWALFVIALVESSVFPIPPDVLLIAVVAAAPRKWMLAAALCSLGSVVGAALGYGIGYGFMAGIGDAIVEFYGAQHHWDRVVDIYTGPWGLWFLAAASFTPIPFKIATLAAGATGMPFVPFLVISAVGRAGRFFLVAAILRLFGAPVRRVLEKHFDLAAVAFFVLLVGGFLAIKAL